MWLPIVDVIKESEVKPERDINALKEFEVSWLMDLVDVKIYELKKDKVKNYTEIIQYSTINTKLQEIKRKAM